MICVGALWCTLFSFEIYMKTNFTTLTESDEINPYISIAQNFPKIVLYIQQNKAKCTYIKLKNTKNILKCSAK